ncbi:MAG: hypothetical protein JWO39_2794, partial [Gemmatimonadetes bacterium]|nr:hypothetical protein [Gemmatimonadota bacterium]
HVAQKVSSSGRMAEPHVTQDCAVASLASERLPQCAQNGSPASLMLPHHPQLTVSPSGTGVWGVRESSSARAALEARLPMLGDGRWRCGGRAPTDGPDGMATTGCDADDGNAESAAAPTGFPQSMQYSESGVFERPQNAQTVKLEPPGSTPVRRVNIGRGQYEEQ